jgi:hypothetical protein
MSEGTFGTAINCMDGRVQMPIINWMTREFQLDYVDMITEPGPDKILAEGTAEQQNIIKNKVDISVNKHGSKIVVIMGHDDCAGNPVPKEQHLGQIKQAMQIIKSWNYPVQIIGVWLDINWQVEIVNRI